MEMQATSESKVKGVACIYVLYVPCCAYGNMAYGYTYTHVHIIIDTVDKE